MVAHNKKLLADDAQIVLSDEQSSDDDSNAADFLSRSQPGESNERPGNA